MVIFVDENVFVLFPKICVIMNDIYIYIYKCPPVRIILLK
jgi:hypothetical protein